MAEKKKNRQSTFTVLLFLSALLKNIRPLTENCLLQIVQSNNEKSPTDFENELLGFFVVVFFLFYLRDRILLKCGKKKKYIYIYIYVFFFICFFFFFFFFLHKNRLLIGI